MNSAVYPVGRRRLFIVASHHDDARDSQATQISDRLGCAGPDSISDGNQAADVRVVADDDDRMPRIRHGRQSLMKLRRLQSTLFQQAMGPKPEFTAVNLAGRSSALKHLKVVRWCDGNTTLVGGFQNRSCDRMAAVRFQGGGAFEQFAFVVTRKRHDRLHGRMAARERAGLVECQCLQARRHLDERPAFDQNSLARCGGECGDDAYRRRNHQRTWTGDDQQHQRPVEPD